MGFFVVIIEQKKKHFFTTMNRTLIFALFLSGFIAAEGLYAQASSAGGNSFAPAAGSVSTSKKEVQDEKREELKTKLLKRKMELDGERLQFAPAPSSSNAPSGGRSAAPQNTESTRDLKREQAPAPKAKDSRPNK